ncbi:MAG: carboxypeptidase regulatory-like domain-containing protein, partial [Phycisphaerae bacterium]|nr:carboxypeptidase regulatory-like domain-containing protein [Phycisphaerae bacterium]
MFRQRRALTALITCLLASAASLAQPTSVGPESATLVGRVVDADGEPIAGAFIFVCDHQTGIPVDRATSRPFVDSERGPADAELAYAVSEPDGQFTLPALKPGTYRLMAQRWPQRPADEPPKKLSELILRDVEVCGVQDDVTVPPPAGQTIVLRPLGTGIL